MKRIASAMKVYGFTDADLAEGWKLLQDTGRVTMGRNEGVKLVDTTLFTQLDEWENRWFPLVKATLERRHPAVAARVFKNLNQQVGPAVAVSVSMFLERYEEAVQDATEGAAVKATLSQRGLSDAELGKARALLEQIGTAETGDDLDDDPEAFQKAEAALWSWYLETSQVARTAITQKALLRVMGFGGSRRGSKGGDEGIDGEDEEPTPDPVVDPKPNPEPTPAPI